MTGLRDVAACLRAVFQPKPIPERSQRVPGLMEAIDKMERQAAALRDETIADTLADIAERMR